MVCACCTWHVVLADMACVYVDLHDVAGGNVCGLSGRGCGGWLLGLDISRYVRVSGGWLCVRDVGPDAGCVDGACNARVVMNGCGCE